MAKRRMFNIDVMSSDKFCGLSMRAQLLYLHLNLSADDDGIVGNPKGIMRGLYMHTRYLDELVTNGYVLKMNSGVVVISHWHAHNQIRKDRYIETRYIDELGKLKLEHGIYSLENEKNETEGSDFFGNHLATQDSIEKNSIEKERIEKCSSEKCRTVECSTGDKDATENEASEFEKDGETVTNETLNKSKRSSSSINKEEKNETEQSRENKAEESKERAIDEPQVKKPAYIDTLDEADRERYFRFLYELQIYFIKHRLPNEYKEFVAYNEGRYWIGKNGESVLEFFEKYVMEWIRHKHIKEK